MAKNKQDKATNKIKKGRATVYTPQIGELICARLMEGESLRKICEDDNMPAKGTVCVWLASTDGIYKSFQDQYAHARTIQAEMLADEIIDISDDGLNDKYKDANGNIRVDQDVIARSRLRVESRKWVAAKLLPKKYGEKLDLTTGGEKLPKHTNILTNLTDEQLAALEALAAANSDTGREVQA